MTYEKRERFPRTSICSSKTWAIKTRQRFDRYDPQLVGTDDHEIRYEDSIFAESIVTT